MDECSGSSRRISLEPAERWGPSGNFLPTVAHPDTVFNCSNTSADIRSLRYIQNKINGVKDKYERTRNRNKGDQRSIGKHEVERHGENWDPAESTYLSDGPTANIPLNHHEPLVFRKSLILHRSYKSSQITFVESERPVCSTTSSGTPSSARCFTSF